MEETSRAAPSASAGTETILLVEDEPALRVMVREELARQGYTVLEAHDGEQALQISRQHEGRIHLLLTDVVMPRMGGHELAQRLAVLRPGIRVLYISGYTDSAVVHQGVLDPGIAFLQKPFAAAALARRVREVLEGS